MYLDVWNAYIHRHFMTRGSSDYEAELDYIIAIMETRRYTF